MQQIEINGRSVCLLSMMDCISSLWMINDDNMSCLFIRLIGTGQKLDFLICHLKQQTGVVICFACLRSPTHQPNWTFFVCLFAFPMKVWQEGNLKLIKTSCNSWSSDESYKDEALCRERMSRQFLLKVSDASVVRHGFHGCRIKVSFKWRHSEASRWLWLFFLFFWACFHGTQQKRPQTLTFTVLSLFGS